MVKYYKFIIEYGELNIEEFMERYHFEEKDKTLVEIAGKILTRILELEAGIQFLETETLCIVTLGERYDRLYEMVMKANHLMMAYCMECWALDLLSMSYEKVSEFAHEENGKWLGKYHFAGEMSTEKMEEYLEPFAELSVKWDKTTLKPLKSVIYTASYQDKKENGCMHSCEQCENISCNFRKDSGKPIDLGLHAASYGISVIFGGDKK